MTANEAYKQFLLKINKNDSSSNINISKGEFVLRYNEIKSFWLIEKIKFKEASDDIHQLGELLVEDEKLTFKDKSPRMYKFTLPSNYADYSSSYSVATRGKCTDRILYNWAVKPKNVNVLLKDENNNPSFDYEETIVTVTDGNLNVFYNDFEVNDVYLSYYREPAAIDIEGYIKVDGTQSTNIDPDISDRLVNEILNRIALEVIRSYENPEGYQLSADRIKQEY